MRPRDRARRRPGLAAHGPARQRRRRPTAGPASSSSTSARIRALVFVFLYLPILVVVVYAFNDTTKATSVWEGFSTRGSPSRSATRSSRPP